MYLLLYEKRYMDIVYLQLSQNLPCLGRGYDMLKNSSKYVKISVPTFNEYGVWSMASGRAQARYCKQSNKDFQVSVYYINS